MATVEVKTVRETTRTIHLDEYEIEEALKEWAVLKHGFTEACDVTLNHDYGASAVIVEKTTEA